MKAKISKVLLILITIFMLIPVSVFADTNMPKVGVVTGGLFDSYVLTDNPNAIIEYYNSVADLPLALDSGKIDGYAVDEPVAKLLCNINKDHYISKKLSFDNYGIIINKENNELTSQLEEYINSLTYSGKLVDMQDVWLGNDDSRKQIDFDSIKDNEPKLVLATATSMEPFDYIQNGEYSGYEIYLVVSFCKEYGYGLQIQDSNFSGVLASVATGKADLGTCVISITEERSESVNFSPCIYEGGVVYVKKQKTKTEYINSFEDLNDKNIGIQTGFAYDLYISEKIKNPQIQYYNTVSDMTAALDSNKISSFVVDKPVAEVLINQNNEKYQILGDLKDVSYGVVFPRSNSNSEKLCSEFNEYIKKIKMTGVLEEKYSKWVSGDESDITIYKEDLMGENGTLVFATSTSTGAPFSYVVEDEIVGFDIDLVYSFAKEYGYDIRLEDYSFSGMLTAIPSGKCDIAASGIAITDERKETMYFPEPYLESSCVVVVKKEIKDNSLINNYGDSFFGKIIDGINKTFIREDRYKLFLSGIFSTILITVSSIIIGTLLGFVVYMLYINIPTFGQTIIKSIINFIQKTPVIVMLMIFYYLIFDGAHLTGISVSIIGLSILFASSIAGLLMMGVSSIDKGQMEAAFTLGYTKNHAFVKIVLPQAIINVISGYKSAIVQLIKDSAVVGYIAVQDLTKVGDIIRSRTYEAFFPLIVTAIIYYLIASILVYLIGKIEIKIDPKKRTNIPVLKGVKTND